MPAAFLVVQIAHTEDAKRYSGPVTYWNDQLQSLLGLSWGQLDRVRKKAIDGGWLHYEKGGKGKVGRYWTTIPPGLGDLPDDPTDEDFAVPPPDDWPDGWDQLTDAAAPDLGDNGRPDAVAQSGPSDFLSALARIQTRKEPLTNQFLSALARIQTRKETGGGPISIRAGAERTVEEPWKNRGTNVDHSTLNLNLDLSNNVQNPHQRGRQGVQRSEDGQPPPSEGDDGDKTPTLFDLGAPVKTPPPPPPDDRAFERFWAVVPHKIKRDRARRAFAAARRKLTKRGMTPAAARDHLVERMAAFSKTAVAEGEYCPHPSTWLNDGRYDDDPKTWEKTYGRKSAAPYRNRTGDPEVRAVRV